MAATAASDSSLVLPTGQTFLGPGLTVGMGEASMVPCLNAWGAARDSELLDLKANLSATQVGVSSASFDQAKETLLAIVTDFRAEAGTMRQQGQYEAAQSVARLELVVGEARAKFDVQDVRFADGLSELAQRFQAVDAWAQAEPARVAAIVQAAPAPPWLPTSPGGTTYFPLQPDMRPAPASPPPRAQQPQDPWATFQSPAAAPALDPWATGHAAQAAQEPPGGPRHFEMGTPGGKGAYPYPREMRIDARSWGDHRKLDVGTSFEGFQVWKDRAMMFLSRERPDIRRLLTWAEGQSKDSLEERLHAQAGHFGVADLASAEYAIHDGIKLIILDSLLGRARNCVERGCELWRSLGAEWSGAAPQLKQAKARRYQEPPRCKDITELWSRLPAWERLGEEVLSTGLELPEWMRSAALERLLPQPLLSTLVARPELATYETRLAWVQTQMEYARGQAQATAFGPGTGKDAAGDLHELAGGAARVRPL